MHVLAPDQRSEFNCDCQIFNGVAQDTGVRSVILQWQVVDAQASTEAFCHGRLHRPDFKDRESAGRPETVPLGLECAPNTLNRGTEIRTIKVLKPVDREMAFIVPRQERGNLGQSVARNR